MFGKNARCLSSVSNDLKKKNFASCAAVKLHEGAFEATEPGDPREEIQCPVTHVAKAAAPALQTKLT